MTVSLHVHFGMRGGGGNVLLLVLTFFKRFHPAHDLRLNFFAHFLHGLYWGWDGGHPLLASPHAGLQHPPRHSSFGPKLFPHGVPTHGRKG